MNSYLDKLNLRPSEKRLVVLVAAIVFVVLNVWFVLPHFSDWQRMKNRMAQAQRKLDTFNAEVAQMKTYQGKVRAMENEGASVPPEEQAVQFQRAIQMQQAQSGVNIVGTSKQSTRTNQFFMELSQTISIVAQEEGLVDFLYNLGAGNSLIRVRDLTVKPDAQRQQLTANVKLVASYQKKAPVRAVQPAPAAVPASTSKKAAPPAAAAPAKNTAPAGARTTPPPAPVKHAPPAASPAGPAKSTPSVPTKSASPAKPANPNVKRP